MSNKLSKNKSEKLQNTPSEISDSEVFSTFDLGCASALITEDFELLNLNRENPRKVMFVFRREIGIEKVANEFWSDHLEQKSRSFWDNIKTLKNRLYSND